MDAFDAISTKIEVRQFASKRVSGEIKRKVLESARLTGSAMNTQHWRFVLVQDKANLKKLAGDSTSGKWVGGADFAIMILTDPKLRYGLLDAGRVIQDMQLGAWNFGVGSGIFSGIEEAKLRKDYALPEGLNVAAILGFGYPTKKILGKKDRKPLEDLVSVEKFGQKFKASDLS
jgi:nitroreductase